MSTPLVLISAGEPAGIGPDCILLAWAANAGSLRDCCICAPVAWLEERSAMLGLNVRLRAVEHPQASEHTLNCWNPLSPDISSGPVHCAIPSASTAEAVLACIEAAALSCMRGEAAAMVTGPIEKAILRDSGFNFPGHTEFLAHLAGDTPFVMMLASDALRVALLTTHMAIAEVPDALSVDQTVQCLRIVHDDLHKRFAIKTPRIGLCGLNPHAGEAGHFGREEIDVLTPAAEQARHAGIDVRGPLPADTLFSPVMRSDFDVIVCCYHDQGLIPIKALSFGEAVNITLGLPFIRTSVDHGTALDRAGSGKVSYSSLVAAIECARFMQINGQH
ncbi:MAG: 4-hydroxythreonine-4-phosphate dehydrogenase PdxA [Mariprofundaceae bacterium]|nr:4-hydroxythreonine-4-phosphate dehydrogenase PdxA [Mariprofundaceae bacterium]